MATRRRTLAPIFLAEWMEHLKVGDRELADRLAVERETVTRWRGGQRGLTAVKIARIASALKLGPLDLWRHPAEPSLDAMLIGKSDEVRRRVLRTVEAMIEPD